MAPVALVLMATVELEEPEKASAVAGTVTFLEPVPLVVPDVAQDADRDVIPTADVVDLEGVDDHSAIAVARDADDRSTWADVTAYVPEIVVVVVIPLTAVPHSKKFLMPVAE